MAWSVGRSENQQRTPLPDWSPKPRPGDTVYLAMSGGVDSSVIALLLSQSGIPDLTLKPIFMRNWSTLEESTSFEPGSGGVSGCSWQSEYASVQSVCKALNLPEPELIDFQKEYWNAVFGPSLDDWEKGRTPNPDVRCNREIKFGALLDRLIPPAIRGSDGGSGTSSKTWLATGHYARLVLDETSSLLPQLHRAIHREKDQSYFLSSVPATALAHVLFPLADIRKDEVKKLAKEWQLSSADRKESMGLCFVGKRDRPSNVASSASPASEDSVIPSGMPKTISRSAAPPATNSPSFGSWLSSYLPSSAYTEPGPIVPVNNVSTVLGTHAGLHTLTIGQRVRLPNQPHKLFVAKKELIEQRQSQPRGRIIVVDRGDHPLLTCRRITLKESDFSWVSPDERRSFEDGRWQQGQDLEAQIRHRTDAFPCRVRLSVSENAQLDVDFAVEGSRPLSVSAGQVVALYRGSRCLGSAVIPEDGVKTLAFAEAEGPME